MRKKNKKIIGVDAGCLGVKDERLKAGVYQVVLNLLNHLGRMDKKNRYRLYSFYPIDKEIMSRLGKRTKNIVLKPKKGWFSLRLPLELAIHPVDVFLGASQALPYSSSHNILIVYDLAFEYYPQFYQDSYKLKKNTRFALKRAEKIIAISKATKKDLIRLYKVAEKKIVVCYPGAGKHFSPQGEKFELNTPYFLFVGSLKKKKNLPRVLKGFAQFLKKSKCNFKLVLVGGDFWFDPEIPRTIQKLNLKRRVLMAGFVKEQDLPKFYRGARGFVSPSLYEGFGITFLEAMACGAPVIAGNMGSMPEIVGEAGILVNPQSKFEIAKALARLASDEELAKKLADKGLKKAQKFSWEKFAKQILKVIKVAGEKSSQK